MFVALPLLFALLTTPTPPEDATFAEVVKEVSSAFLERPYVRSPLGEGEGIDPDPRFRTDAFDCLTMVETAIALAHGRDEREAALILDDIRYLDGASPAFERRLHLMEAQWLPDMVRKGYLEEVTPRYGGEHTEWLTLELDEAGWSKRRVLRALPWEPSLGGRFEVPFLPLAHAETLADSLPEGLVIDVVREARDNAITRITHTGIIVIHDGVRYVRHAALRQRKVIDEPLTAFLRRQRWLQWPVIGVHLSAIRENQDRVGALVEEAPLLSADG